MVKRENKRKDLWKNLLAVLAVAAVIVAIALVAGFSWREKYDTDYFVSDDKKLVIAMDKEVASFEEGEFEPEITYLVYYYDGDKISDMRVFFAYGDNETARVADENIVMEGKDWAVRKSLNGKYVIFEVDAGQYADLKVSRVKSAIESMQAAGALRE